MRNQAMHTKIGFVLLLLALTAACQRAEPAPAQQAGLRATISPVITVTSMRLTPSPPDTTATVATVNKGAIAIIGTVQDVMISAQVIVLKTPIQGIQYVALHAGTVIRSREGQPIDLQDLQPGDRIQAIGQPSSADTLLADEVHILP